MTLTNAARHNVIRAILGATLLTACGGAAGSGGVASNTTVAVAPGDSTVAVTAGPTTVMTALPAPTLAQSAATAIPVQATPQSTATQGETQVATIQPPAATALPSAETMVPTPEAALAPETNPAGDIPDSQAFVQYQAPAGGYLLDTPEGWARTVSGSDVSFVDKFNGVSVTITSVASAPTAATARANEVAAIKQHGRAVDITSVKDVKLPSGPAVLVVYTSNSDPNPVTNKQVRLENNSYLFFKNGKLATLRLYAVLGADNVDQWKRMSDSFRWR